MIFQINIFTGFTNYDLIQNKMTLMSISSGGNVRPRIEIKYIIKLYFNSCVRLSESRRV